MTWGPQLAVGRSWPALPPCLGMPGSSGCTSTQLFFSVKGTVSPAGHCFEGIYNQIITLCTCSQYFKIYGLLCNRANKVSAWFFENMFCSSFRLPSLVDFIQCTSYIHGLLPEQISGSQEAFRTTFRVTGGFRKARTASLKRVTRRVFTISKWFNRCMPKLYFGCSSQKDSRILWKLSSLLKSTVLIFSTSKTEIFILCYFLAEMYRIEKQIWN